MKKVIIPRCAISSMALILMAPSLAMAGNLAPTAAPSSAGSAVYTTGDIYNRLQAGTTGAKRTGGFSEPAALPADGVGKSIDQVMSVAPAADNSNGLKANEAPSGKTFWGLNAAGGGWGPRTGTNANVIDTTEATAPAAAATISSGKKAFVNGALVTGSKPNTRVFTCSGTMYGTRWCDNGNGTIKDMTTGLIWLKNANCTATLAGVAKTAVLNFNDADIWSSALVSGQCGLTDGSTEGDWRLPTKNELAGLVSGTEGVFDVTPGPFSGVQSSVYWSSTTNNTAPGYGWFVGFSAGYGVGSNLKIYGYYVLPVRGGQ